MTTVVFLLVIYLLGFFQPSEAFLWVPVEGGVQWYCLARAEVTAIRNFCHASCTSAVNSVGPNLAAMHRVMCSARSLKLSGSTCSFSECITLSWR
uniref:Secreted protein n=1 Tax=Anguilla anguilla TaxID=7936 RepID=A0A0E9XCL0_ANGAN